MLTFIILFAGTPVVVGGFAIYFDWLRFKLQRDYAARQKNGIYFIIFPMCSIIFFIHAVPKSIMRVLFFRQFEQAFHISIFHKIILVLWLSLEPF